MKIKIKKLHPDAIIPTYATPGAACFDLHAMNGEGFLFGKDTMKLKGRASAVFGTDLSFEIPKGHVMLVYSRSGHGFKNGVRLSNCVGVIDSDYRGEVKVKLTNDSPFDFTVLKCDRIAQAMIMPVEQVDFIVVDELSETDRGVGGFGSTNGKVKK